MEQIKSALKWIVLPFTLLAGAIFYLLQANRGLKDDLSNERAGREMDGINGEIRDAKTEADAAEAAYIVAANELYPDRRDDE
jgi:hypothetical protein